MILSLDDLPALSRSWLTPLEETDPGLYADLAQSLVIDVDGEREPSPFAAKVGAVLAALNLRGKEIGAFRLAPTAEGDTASQQIKAYDSRLRQRFDTPPAVTFLGEYGSGQILAMPSGIALLDPEAACMTRFAADFEAFLIAQANAFDAYKAHIVKDADELPYRARQVDVQAHPRFTAIDAEAIFTAQLEA